jgi:endonuclease/exonuclease/phosphatase (EEP) superfamily protein YafD
MTQNTTLYSSNPYLKARRDQGWPHAFRSFLLILTFVFSLLLMALPVLPMPQQYCVELANAYQYQVCFVGLGLTGVCTLVAFRHRSGWWAKMAAAVLWAMVAYLWQQTQAELHLPTQVKPLKQVATTTGHPITVLQHNVYHDAISFKPALRLLATTAADIVALQEVDNGIAKQFIQHKPLSKQYPYAASQPWSNVMLLSVWPITHCQYHTVHRRNHFRFVIIEAVVQHPSQPFRVVVVHPPHPTGVVPFQEHQKLYKAMTTIVNASPLPTVVLGDFNSTRFSPQFQRFLVDTGLAQVTGEVHQGTWQRQQPAFLRLDIDHIAVSPHIQVQHFSVLLPTLSDHLPIKAELLLP